MSPYFMSYRVGFDIFSPNDYVASIVVCHEMFGCQQPMLSVAINKDFMLGLVIMREGLM